MSDEQDQEFRQLQNEFDIYDDRSCYEQKLNLQIEYEIVQNNDFNQNISSKQQFNNMKTTQEDDSEKTDYKNLPKLIGNNFQKYLEQNQEQIPKTKGLETFLNERKSKKDKDKKKEKQKEKQISTKISDLRQICQTDVQSKRVFKKFIKKQFMIDLIHSTKIENPLKYIDGISTYYAAADEPDKMISSHIISSKKKLDKS